MQGEERRALALAALRQPHFASGHIDITSLFFRRRGCSCRFRCVGLPACRECQCTTGCEKGSSAQLVGHMQQQAVTKKALEACGRDMGNTRARNGLSIGSSRHVSSSKYPRSYSIKLTNQIRSVDESLGRNVSGDENVNLEGFAVYKESALVKLLDE